MDTIKFEKRQVRMVAHRGLSGIERENTCPAFIAAANRSYYGVETDVHVTQDGQFVILHDAAGAARNAFRCKSFQQPIQS